jgi:hypothetical protein
MVASLTGQVWPGELASLSGYAATGVAGGPVRGFDVESAASMANLDPDVVFVARSLVRRYGNEAKRHSLERISRLLDDGDSEACVLWQKVADAIDELTAF